MAELSSSPKSLFRLGVTTLLSRTTGAQLDGLSWLRTVVPPTRYPPRSLFSLLDRNESSRPSKWFGGGSLSLAPEGSQYYLGLFMETQRRLLCTTSRAVGDKPLGRDAVSRLRGRLTGSHSLALLEPSSSKRQLLREKPGRTDLEANMMPSVRSKANALVHERDTQVLQSLWFQQLRLLGPSEAYDVADNAVFRDVVSAEMMQNTGSYRTVQRKSYRAQANDEVRARLQRAAVQLAVGLSM